MSCYREANVRETHSLLDAHCRRCGVWGHRYLYFPVDVGAGPLCRQCFVEWRGVAVGWRFGTVGVGLSTWPVEERLYGPPRYDVVTVDGVGSHEPPLQCPPPKANTKPTSEENTLLSRLVRWLQ